jgi:hypothetical protein
LCAGVTCILRPACQLEGQPWPQRCACAHDPFTPAPHPSPPQIPLPSGGLPVRARRGAVAHRQRRHQRLQHSATRPRRAVGCGDEGHTPTRCCVRVMSSSAAPPSPSKPSLPAPSPAALSPHHIVLLFATRGVAAWRTLGAAMLCVTGVEALFADLGHFSRTSISVSPRAATSGLSSCTKEACKVSSVSVRLLSNGMEGLTTFPAGGSSGAGLPLPGAHLPWAGEEAGGGGVPHRPLPTTCAPPCCVCCPTGTGAALLVTPLTGPLPNPSTSPRRRTCWPTPPTPTPSGPRCPDP